MGFVCLVQRPGQDSIIPVFLKRYGELSFRTAPFHPRAHFLPGTSQAIGQVLGLLAVG